VKPPTLIPILECHNTVSQCSSANISAGAKGAAGKSLLLRLFGESGIGGHLQYFPEPLKHKRHNGKPREIRQHSFVERYAAPNRLLRHTLNAGFRSDFRYLAASILSTLTTPVFGNRVPVTLTFWATNCSGVF